MRRRVLSRPQKAATSVPAASCLCAPLCECGGKIITTERDDFNCARCYLRLAAFRPRGDVPLTAQIKHCERFF